MVALGRQSVRRAMHMGPVFAATSAPVMGFLPTSAPITLAPMIVVAAGAVAAGAAEAFADRLEHPAFTAIRPYAAAVECIGARTFRELPMPVGVDKAANLAVVGARLREGGAARARARQGGAQVDTNALMVFYLTDAATIPTPEVRTAVQNAVTTGGHRSGYEVLVLLGNIQDITATEQALTAWSSLGPCNLCILEDRDVHGRQLSAASTNDLQLQVASLLLAVWASGGSTSLAWQPLFRVGRELEAVSAGIARRTIDRGYIRKHHELALVLSWLSEGLLHPGPLDLDRADALSDAVVAAVDQAREEPIASAAQRLRDNLRQEVHQIEGELDAVLAKPHDRSGWHRCEAELNMLIDDRLERDVERETTNLRLRFNDTAGPLAQMTELFAAAMRTPSISLATLHRACNDAVADLEARSGQRRDTPERANLHEAWEALRNTAGAVRAPWWMIAGWYITLGMLLSSTLSALLETTSARFGLDGALPGTLRLPETGATVPPAGVLSGLVVGAIAAIGVIHLSRRPFVRQGSLALGRAALLDGLVAYADGRIDSLTDGVATLTYQRLTAVAGVFTDLRARLPRRWADRSASHIATNLLKRSSREYGLPGPDDKLPAAATPQQAESSMLEALTGAVYTAGTPVQWSTAADVVECLIERLLEAATPLVEQQVAAIQVTDLLAEQVLPPTELFVDDAGPLCGAASLVPASNTYRLLLVDHAAPNLAADLHSLGEFIPSLEPESAALVTLVRGIDISTWLSSQAT